MPCIVPLPDGTFLIVNGAKEGVAGFGLAGNPNLDALLYDPVQPVGQRFSNLASTTIPRMYHSEAILLPDARVLISGSDPQTPGFQQETRIEVSFSFESKHMNLSFTIFRRSILLISLLESVSLNSLSQTRTGRMGPRLPSLSNFRDPLRR
jgi:hypothetical protein